MKNNRNLKKVTNVTTELTDDEAYKKALKTALNIIAVRDNTESVLRKKLLYRGYTEETVQSVIEYLLEKGYINEYKMMLNAIQYMADVKLYGKARIEAELRASGYASYLINNIDYSCNELSEIDFKKNCIKLYIKKGGIADKKTFNFLFRYGHSSDDIRSAIKYQENTDF